jgi:hypothetical protein
MKTLSVIGIWACIRYLKCSISGSQALYISLLVTAKPTHSYNTVFLT